MILSISLSNHLSIEDRQTFSMMATSLSGETASLIRTSALDEEVLPSAVIYGANASGKTNLLKAVGFLRGAVLHSHVQSQRDSKIPRRPFLLGGANEKKPTTIEIDFVYDGTRYNFGFGCTEDAFVNEWLYSFPEGKPRRLYEREGQEVEFGSTFRGPKKVLVDFMRPNSLFISTATQNNHEVLSQIVDFFRNLKFSMNVSVSMNLLNNTFKRNQIDERAIEFISEMGTGVTKHRQKEIEIPDNLRELSAEIFALAKKHAGEGLVEVESPTIEDHDVQIELAHRNSQGEDVFFELDSESSGTRRLLLVMDKVFAALDDGSTVFVDEIDASLHTLAVEQIFRLFHDKRTNPKGAQLIATTHDTNVLCCDLLRRDQIWFCEKDYSGASTFYSLAEMKVRPEANFQKGYLQGRFGAIPFATFDLERFASLHG